MKRRVLAVVIATLVLAGCVKEGPPPETWVVLVCGALTPWRADITEINQRAAAQMAHTTTVEQTRRNLVDLVTEGRDATETARAAIAAAGVPDVPGGEGVAKSFERSLASMRDAYAAADRDLRGLPGGDEMAFYNGVVEVMDRLNRQYEQAGTELLALDSPELRRAFDQAPECQ